ncbi:hypothetical protein BGZ82_002875, partial [Podila clonocystis]
MKSVFQEKILDDLTKSDEEWPDVGFDESLVTSAVREVKDLSEMDFTVKHVGPVMEAFFDSKCISSRLTVRYGKAFLDAGHKMAPLFQIVYTKGTYMRLREAKRGMFVLEEVGPFTIPATVEMITTFMTNIQTLMIAQADIEKIANGPLDQLKRSWGYKDLDKNKRLLVQGSKG